MKWDLLSFVVKATNFEFSDYPKLQCTIEAFGVDFDQLK